MRKPADFDKVQAFGEFIPLELGGHILTIIGVRVEETENGKTRVVVGFDTHTTDKQPKYYDAQYKNNTRADKKWGGTKIEWPFKNDGGTNPFFKKFTDAIAASNKNFKLEWDEQEGVHKKFEASFKGMLVGGVFGREEYTQNGLVKNSIRCFEFRSVEAIKAGVEIPKDKLIDGSSIAQSDLIPVHDDGDSPF